MEGTARRRGSSAALRSQQTLHESASPTPREEEEDIQISDAEDEGVGGAQSHEKRKRDSPHKARTVQAPIALYEEIKSSAAK